MSTRTTGMEGSAGASLADDDAEASPRWEPVQRRGILGTLSKGGMVMVAGLAGLLATAEPAAADCLGSPCCNLVSCHRCGGSCRYTCPSGYYRRYWFCMSGARFIGCGECTRNVNSCWDSRVSCSVWWDDAYCP